jgi:hypothetical protein
VTDFLKVLGGLLAPLLLSSCEVFTGDYEAESHVLFLMEKSATGGCVTSLHVDGDYVARVEVDNCAIYLHTITSKEN